MNKNMTLFESIFSSEQKSRRNEDGGRVENKELFVPGKEGKFQKQTEDYKCWKKDNIGICFYFMLLINCCNIIGTNLQKA